MIVIIAISIILLGFYCAGLFCIWSSTRRAKSILLIGLFWFVFLVVLIGLVGLSNMWSGWGDGFTVRRQSSYFPSTLVFMLAFTSMLAMLVNKLTVSYLLFAVSVSLLIVLDSQGDSMYLVGILTMIKFPLWASIIGSQHQYRIQILEGEENDS